MPSTWRLATRQKGAPGSNCVAATPEPSEEGSSVRRRPLDGPAAIEQNARLSAEGFSPMLPGIPAAFAVVASGCSTGGRCPAPGMIASSAPGMASAIARACSGGVRVSPSPATTRVGTSGQGAEQGLASLPIAHGGQGADQAGHRRAGHECAHPLCDVGPTRQRRRRPASWAASRPRWRPRRAPAPSPRRRRGLRRMSGVSASAWVSMSTSPRTRDRHCRRNSNAT